MDYNIYIHDKTSGQSKPTQARVGGGTKTTPKESASQSQSSDGKLSAASQLFKVGKAGKTAAIIYAVYKITDKVVSTIEPFVTRETGDYRFNVAYNNYKSALGVVLNPVGSVTSYLSYQQEMRLFNQKQEQSRMLIGESSINSSSRKV